MDNPKPKNSSLDDMLKIIGAGILGVAIGTGIFLAVKGPEGYRSFSGLNNAETEYKKTLDESTEFYKKSAQEYHQIADDYTNMSAQLRALSRKAKIDRGEIIEDQ